MEGFVKINSLSAKLLEQWLELSRCRQLNQSLHQSRARLAVGDLEFLAIGLAIDVGQEKTSLLGVGKVVHLEHFVGALEVFLLVLVQHTEEDLLLGRALTLTILMIAVGVCAILRKSDKVLLFCGRIYGINTVDTVFGSLSLGLCEIFLDILLFFKLSLLLLASAASLLQLARHLVSTVMVDGVMRLSWAVE